MSPIFINALERVLGTESTTHIHGNEDDSHAIFGDDNGYVIVRVDRENDGAKLIVPSDRLLPDTLKISETGLRHLHAAGFRRRTAARPFEASHPADVNALAELVSSLLREVYGSESEASEVHLGARDPHSAPALIEAMRHLSKTRDMSARQGVYRQLVEATLLVPTTQAPTHPQAIQGVGVELRIAGELSGHPTMAAFTDIETLRRADPRGYPYLHLSGRVLVPLLIAQKAGSLLINPGGDVGGELYVNELHALNDFITRTAGRH